MSLFLALAQTSHGSSEKLLKAMWEKGLKRIERLWKYYNKWLGLSRIKISVWPKDHSCGGRQVWDSDRHASLRLMAADLLDLLCSRSCVDSIWSCILAPENGVYLVLHFAPEFFPSIPMVLNFSEALHPSFGRTRFFTHFHCEIKRSKSLFKATNIKN